jgi:carboxyl-terminal processing protease
MEQKINLLGNLLEERSINPIEETKMVEGIYKGYVYGLGDASTTYLTNQELTKLLAREEGAYMGTGIEFTWSIGNDYLVVTNVLKDSPADQAGIVVGDRILKIEDTKAKSSNDTLLYEMLTDIEAAHTYTIADQKGENQKEISLQAALVQRQLLESEILQETIGYVKLNGIKENVSKDLRVILEDLKEQGAKSFILDVRNVESNAMDEITQIASLFIENQTLFYVDKGEEEVIPYTSVNPQEVFKEPLAVIANRSTKGTTEALVAAIKTSKRGTIIGSVTAKAGTVQQIFELEDGSGLSITIGNILDANKELIRQDGVAPDIAKSPTTEESIEIVTTGSLAKERDSLIQAAIQELLNEGGI